MKKNLLYSAALATGLILTPGRGWANVPISSSGGDLILGFEASGSPDDLEVNLGPASQFLNATSPFTVTFGLNPTTSATVTNLYSDLGIFGANGAWASNTSLLWGAVGAVSNEPTSNSFDIYLTQDPALGTSIENQGYSTTRTWATHINALDSASGLGAYSNDGYSTEAAAISTGAPNSWSSGDPDTTSFGTQQVVEQADGDSAIGSLNLLEDVPPGNNANGSDAKNLGTFTLNSAGDLTFTPAAVPEPSTWLSLIGGGLFLALFRRHGTRASRPA
jgi:hypothetical protein